jgi:hypothetical protein
MGFMTQGLHNFRLNEYPMRPTFTEEGLSHLVGHWSPEEIAATEASRECVASFLGYLERVTETPAEEADKAKVTAHLKERLAENPEYDEWRGG